MDTQHATLNKLRAIFAKAAHTNQHGEAKAFAAKGFEMFKRYGFTMDDLTAGQRKKDRDYILHNFRTAKKVWEAQDEAQARQEEAKARAGKFWVSGYTRKDGRVVKGYWRFVKPGQPKEKKEHTGPNGETRDGFTWVNGYTRADRRVVRGYWRKAR